MKTFPMYVKSEGRTAILCGSGRLIRLRADQLLSFGFRPKLFAGQVTEVTESLRAQGIPVEYRPLALEDLTGQQEDRPLLAVSDEDEEETARIRSLCLAASVPLNAVDRPAYCDFYFPALIQRDEICVAVGTAGSSPALAAELKLRLEEALPDVQASAEILHQLTRLRASLKEEPAATRRTVLRATASEALDKGRALTEEELAALRAECISP